MQSIDIDVDEEVPILINHDLPNLQSILDQADVILQVLDARDPLAFRSSHLEELAVAKPGREIIWILNKIGAFILVCVWHALFCPNSATYVQILFLEKL